MVTVGLIGTHALIVALICVSLEAFSVLHRIQYDKVNVHLVFSP